MRRQNEAFMGNRRPGRASGFRCGWRWGVLAGSLIACGLVRLARGEEVASPLAPADALRVMQLADPQLAVELVACEPEVIDPIAIRFDETGRMWVVEMRDYPLGNPQPGGPPLSRIRILSDRDGDGRCETATTFADGLLFVTGVQPWRGGAFVTLSGALVYMQDTDGDGRADLKETWFEGFAEQNSQLRANHPRLAWDGWIYVANGLRGGVVVNRRREQPPINISGMDFRFDPRTGWAEAVSGNGQYGLYFDDAGRRFNCSNRNPVRQVVLEDRYLRANPGVIVPGTVHDVAAFGEQSRIFPISRAWTTSNLHAGQFTAACGVFVYRGHLLPEAYRGNLFTCDPTGNLVHREVVVAGGPALRSQPAYPDRDFLRSPDEWFRPVNLELGPDGALYVVDMYRCVIEHPDFVPDELKRRPDQRWGDDRGRIWRIVPKTATHGAAAGGTPRWPADCSPPELVALLDHPNAWQRECAQRLLLERSDALPVEALATLARSGRLPGARVQALALLVAHDPAAARPHLQSALDDPHPDVRRLALVLLESTEGPLPEAALARLEDRDAGVRFQARLTVSLRMPAEARARLAHPERLPSVLADAGDAWQRHAVRLCLGAGSCGAMARQIVAYLQHPPRDLPPKEAVAALLAELCEQAGAAEAASERSAALAALPLLAPQPDVAVAALAAGARGLNRRRATLGEVASSEELARLRQDLASLAAEARQSLAVRRGAVELLGFVPEAGAVLWPLCRQEADPALRVAAIGALARQGTSQAPWDGLISHFTRETPAIRRAILEALLQTRERTEQLLEAIAAGRIRPAEIEPALVRRLTEHRDAAIRQKASTLLASLTPADRAAVLAEYQVVLTMAGDARRGQAVFEKHCAACHRIGDVGVNVAPDISDSRTKKPEQLLTDILQPNRAIDNNYLSYTVQQVDGTVLTGILAAETATSITLRQQGGKEVVIPRSEIEELKSSGLSLMPEGLERSIDQQQMADLIAFIKHWRYLDGRTPLGSAGSGR
jgi:putative membrane-bound dehydrogenase-like protein